MSDFEKWFKTTEAYKMLEEQNYFKMDLFFFVGARNQYRHSGVQVAYLTWQHQQAIIDNLKAQLNNMETCYIEKKKQVEDQQKRIDDGLEKIHQFGKEGCLFPEWLIWAEKALRGGHDSLTDARQKAEDQINNGARLTKHQIDL